MELVLDLQAMEDTEGAQFGGGSGGGHGSNLSLLASCNNSTISLLTCH
ncbi:SapB/AmfS family lanthipeptide [Amycolatopsis suaedae]|uniref:SapB/AmfS family lantipeptide n=1 Tax=Amycolatopsis suaedae TaxID=2510978 RepID=A0A4Q7J7A2_9PSEU|nr:SapB/AmfS family lanthipeptide [Amycolatopsis suaedae]RZQ61894.1 SapB/AmfS family lantipeptide [Amycolatopsis suaedae]